MYGDPCFATPNKQMLIQYQCVDNLTLSQLSICPEDTNVPSNCPTLTNPSTQNQEYWCEPDTAQINCPEGKVINILCGFYGIDPNIRCAGGFYSGAPTACYSEESLDKIKAACQSKQTCTIEGDPSFLENGFSDSCPGYSNMLFIQWECLTPSIDVETTQSNIPTTISSLPECDSYEAPDGECPTHFPRMPSFLQNSSESSFGYPIYQQINCNSVRTVLVCPDYTVIHIYSAYFGIQSSTKGPCLSSSTSELPEMCFDPIAFEAINALCEYQQSCVVRPAASSLGISTNPCSAYPFQLFIQYQCVDQKVLNRTINQCDLKQNVNSICPSVDSSVELKDQIWCKNDTMNIQCSVNEVIEITCAYYGLEPSLPSSTCSHTNIPSRKPMCYFKSSSNYVNSTCSNNNSCTISNFSQEFTDPCSGFDEVLYVQWKCKTVSVFN